MAAEWEWLWWLLVVLSARGEEASTIVEGLWGEAGGGRGRRASHIARASGVTLAIRAASVPALSRSS